VLQHFGVNLVNTVDHTMCDNTDAIFNSFINSFPLAHLMEQIGNCFAHLVTADWWFGAWFASLGDVEVNLWLLMYAEQRSEPKKTCMGQGDADRIAARVYF
jgi:hypothetical protein